MSQIRVKCLNCAKQYAAPSNRAGQSLKCLNCGALIQIPGGQASALQRSAGADNSRFVLMIAGAVGGGALLLLVMAIVLSSIGGSSSDDEPAASSSELQTLRTTSDSRQWERFNDRNGRFSIEVPAKPEVEYTTDPAAHLDLVFLSKSLSPRMGYSIHYVKFHKPASLPPPRDRVIKMSNLYLQQQEGLYSIENERWGAYEEQQYFDQVLTIDNPSIARGWKTTHHKRTYYGDDWLVNISWMVVAPDVPDPNDVQYFFESFEALDRR
jgi:ribosomal protein S27E